MRDDTLRWRACAGLDRPAVTGDGIRMALEQPERQMLLSGPYKALLEIAGQSTAAGWPEPAIGPEYAVRLRRDRILLINGPEIGDGWRAEAGVAVSNVTGALVVIELTGAHALDLLRRGAEICLGVPSGSASRLLFGLAVQIYRYGEDGARIRLHVDAPYLETLWSRLESELEDGLAYPQPPEIGEFCSKPTQTRTGG